MMVGGYCGLDNSFLGPLLINGEESSINNVS
jgi:hypothetical protein